MSRPKKSAKSVQAKTSKAAPVSEEAGEFGVCPYTTAQQILSGKWAIIILHILSGGPHRFSEIEKNSGMTHATLSSQLKYLERRGLITRTVYAEVPPRVEYALTEIGEAFKPVLDSMKVWADQYIACMNQQNKEPGKED